MLDFLTDRGDFRVPDKEKERRENFLKDVREYVSTGKLTYIDPATQKLVDATNITKIRADIHDQIGAGVAGAAAGVVGRATGETATVVLGNMLVTFVPFAQGARDLYRAIKVGGRGGSPTQPIFDSLPRFPSLLAPLRKAKDELKQKRIPQAAASIVLGYPLTAVAAGGFVLSSLRQVVDRVATHVGRSSVTKDIFKEVEHQRDLMMRSETDHECLEGLDPVEEPAQENNHDHQDHADHAPHIELHDAWLQDGQVKRAFLKVLNQRRLDGHDPARDAAKIAKDMGWYLSLRGTRGIGLRSQGDAAWNEAFMIYNLAVNIAGRGISSIQNSKGDGEGMRRKNLSQTRSNLKHVKPSKKELWVRALGMTGMNAIVSIPEYIVGFGLGRWAADEFWKSFGPYATEAGHWKDMQLERTGLMQKWQDVQQEAGKKITELQTQTQSYVQPKQGNEQITTTNVSQTTNQNIQRPVDQASTPVNPVEVQPTYDPQPITAIEGVPLAKLQGNLAFEDIPGNKSLWHGIQNMNLIEDGTEQYKHGIFRDDLNNSIDFASVRSKGIRMYNAVSGARVFILHSGTDPQSNIPNPADWMRRILDGEELKNLQEIQEDIKHSPILGQQFYMDVDGKKVLMEVSDIKYIDYEDAYGKNAYFQGDNLYSMWWQRLGSKGSTVFMFCGWNRPDQMDWNVINTLSKKEQLEYFSHNVYAVETRPVEISKVNIAPGVLQDNISYIPSIPSKPQIPMQEIKRDNLISFPDITHGKEKIAAVQTKPPLSIVRPDYQDDRSSALISFEEFRKKKNKLQEIALEEKKSA